MKYKVKKTNLNKLKKYINANTETKTERETTGFYDKVCGGNKQGV
jgi:hypothetical protein